MSIASEIKRIQAAKEALKTAVNSKGGNLTDEKIDRFAEAVASLPESGGVDVSMVTVSAGDILEGKIAVNSNGSVITGTIPAVKAELDGNKVTVPAGFIASGEVFTVAEAAEPQVNGNVVTLFSGYSANERSIAVGNAVAAAEISPGVEEQILPADSYLTGDVVIAGDASLVPGNIRQGAAIFGVAGTFSGSGQVIVNTADLYRCTAVDPGTQRWTGSKAVLVDGEYTFEETPTDGLSFSVIQPKVGKIYTADALALVTYLYAGMPEPYVELPLNSNYTGSINGISTDFSGGVNGTLDFVDGALNFSGDGYLDLPGVTTDLLQGDFTISLKVFQTGTARTAYLAAQSDCFVGIDDYYGKYNMWAGNSGWNILQADSSGYDNSGNGSIARICGEEVTLTYVHEENSWRLYVNGELSVEKNRTGNIATGRILRLGAWGDYVGFNLVGRLRDLKIFREALPESLVQKL